MSRLPFFPDYTDHGPQHLSNVMTIAEKLLGKRSHEVFTPVDSSVLMFSILLHDLAMHLSEAGFSHLISSQHPQKLLALDHEPWPELWREFLAVAGHWDDRTLVRLFGADEKGTPLALVRDPFEHYSNLTESDRKLIGEFIRRHHSRMAHEFAVFGFPGTGDQRINFTEFASELRDLAGLIARSHGMPLRSSFSYLEEHFNKLEYENVHPLFLMSVLRIADYLDLGKDRAPLITFRFRDLASPVSREEFKVNQAFRTISWANPDAESIHIPAKPVDIREFLKLKECGYQFFDQLRMRFQYPPLNIADVVMAATVALFVVGLLCAIWTWGEWCWFKLRRLRTFCSELKRALNDGRRPRTVGASQPVTERMV